MSAARRTLSPSPNYAQDRVLDEPKYLLADVAAAAEVSTNILKAWLTRVPIVVQLGPFDRPAIGKGSSRVFTLRRILAVALTAELVRLGQAPHRAGLLAYRFTDTDMPESRDDWRNQQLPILVAYPGSENFSFIDGANALSDAFDMSTALEDFSLPSDDEELIEIGVPQRVVDETYPLSFVAVDFNRLSRKVEVPLKARGKKI